MEVIVTDEFLIWYENDDLDEQVHDAAYEIVELLASEGIALKFPYQSALRGSKHGCRELRKSAGKHELRIAYKFDPNRDAVVLLAGDKDGDARFYEWFVPRADEIWERYEREQKTTKK
ncbi:MAG TPA: type II toxin-antitoxin system RelE/ParE family toxin [Polyangia bacterium]|nr:type II toxin-antitoxin system RelE/ParE family toxin [Polyangia bacterium]